MNNKLNNKVLLVGIRKSCLGTSVKDDEVTEEILVKHNVQEGSMKATKTRFVEALAPIKTLHGQIGRWLRSVSFPGISEDLRMIPSSRLGMIQEKVAEFKAQQDVLIADIVANYENHLDRERVKLNGRFDPSLYPTAEKFPSYFKIELTTSDMPKGDFAAIEGLSEEAKAQQKAEHDALLVSVGVAARKQVMARMTDLIQKIADKLTNPDAEVYKEATMDNLKTYLNEVAELNVTNDPTIKAMAEQARTTLDFTMAELKKNEFLKQEAVNAAQALLNNFGGMGNRKMVA